MMRFKELHEVSVSFLITHQNILNFTLFVILKGKASTRKASALYTFATVSSIRSPCLKLINTVLKGSKVMILQIDQTKHLLTNSLSYEPRHEKTCLYHMRTTKAQISLRIYAV